MSGFTKRSNSSSSSGCCSVRGSYFAGVVPGAPPLILGLAVVWLVSLVHLSGVQLGSKFQNVSTFIKLGLIVILIVAGLVFGTPQEISFIPTAHDFTYIGSAPFAIGLVFVLYSYSGWNAATYIASEIQIPSAIYRAPLSFRCSSSLRSMWR